MNKKYHIVHSGTNMVLSTHSTKNGALDELEGLGMEKKNYKIKVKSVPKKEWSMKEELNILFETICLDEKLDPSMGADAYIRDFVKSKDPRFKGDSKKQRIKRALGAYYGAKNEEVSVNNVGAGKIAGVGIGPQGEPPVKLKSTILKRKALTKKKD